MEQQAIFIGLDNGVSGALVALRPDGKLVDRLVMPVHTVLRYGESDKHGANQINVPVVQQWLAALAAKEGGANITCVLEMPGGAKSAKAAVSMAGSFHALRTVVELCGLRLIIVTPQFWQGRLLPGETGQTKPEALALANRLWPTEKWLPTPRCSTPDSGLVDAALIAWFVASGEFDAACATKSKSKCPKKKKTKK